MPHESLRSNYLTPKPEAVAKEIDQVLVEINQFTKEPVQPQRETTYHEPTGVIAKAMQDLKATHETQYFEPTGVLD